ncbi:hypothetical protein SDC9_192150 [bioreactor metagenome]|uniref:Uncharacterized protein n=1 Tax=bioreactor metagenome TaxID=1076179 RepID=A0A645HZW2_9ZZZZ
METIIKSVTNKPTDVFRLKYFSKINGGIVVPPLDAWIVYRMETPTAKIKLPKITDNNRSLVNITSGTIRKNNGKTTLPTTVFKKTVLPRKMAAKTKTRIFNDKTTHDRPIPKAVSAKIPIPLTPPAAM